MAASGYSNFGGGGYNPSIEFNNVWDFVQNVAISRGAHAFKMGAEFRSVKFPFFQLPNNHGNFNYSSNETAFPSAASRPSDRPSAPIRAMRSLPPCWVRWIPPSFPPIT